MCFFSPLMSGFERAVAFHVMTVENETSYTVWGLFAIFMGFVYLFFCEFSVYRYRCGMVWYGMVW